jgi:hypothetical protein
MTDERSVGAVWLRAVVAALRAERERADAVGWRRGYNQGWDERADAIEAENARLRSALRGVASAAVCCGCGRGCEWDHVREMERIARAALSADAAGGK